MQAFCARFFKNEIIAPQSRSLTPRAGVDSPQLPADRFTPQEGASSGDAGPPLTSGEQRVALGTTAIGSGLGAALGALLQGFQGWEGPILGCLFGGLLGATIGLSAIDHTHGDGG